MLDWIVHYVATGTLTVVFALALSHKLRSYPRFRASLQAYGIVPIFLLGIVAPSVVLLEAVAAVCLFLPVGPGSLLAFAVLGVYTVAMTVNLARGRRYIRSRRGVWRIDVGLAVGDRSRADLRGLLSNHGTVACKQWPGRGGSWIVCWSSPV
jgi:hypothetical protein